MESLRRRVRRIWEVILMRKIFKAHLAKKLIR